MTTAKVLKSGKSNFLELTESAAFPEFVEEVSVVAIGNTRIITPVDESWDNWFDNPLVTDDFMSDRLQPEDQSRDGF